MAISPDDPIYALRAELAREVVRALGGSFAQWFISRRYGIPQPRMSELCRGNVERCTMEWLIRRIHRMGGTIVLTISLEDEDTRRRRWAIEQRRRRQEAAFRAAKNIGPGDDLHRAGGSSPSSSRPSGAGFLDSPIPNLE